MIFMIRMTFSSSNELSHSLNDRRDLAKITEISFSYDGINNNHQFKSTELRGLAWQRIKTEENQLANWLQKDPLDRIFWRISVRSAEDDVECQCYSELCQSCLNYQQKILNDKIPRNAVLPCWLSTTDRCLKAGDKDYLATSASLTWCRICKVIMDKWQHMQFHDLQPELS